MSSTANRFFVVGNQEKLAIVQDESAYILHRPKLLHFELNYHPSYCEYGMNNGWTERVLRRMEVNATLNLTCGECSTSDSAKDMRFADEMTVRELFSTINRKIIERTGK